MVCGYTVPVVHGCLAPSLFCQYRPWPVHILGNWGGEEIYSFFKRGRVRPGGRVPFCLPKKEPKMPWGPLPVSTLPAAVLTVIAPRPPTTGAGPFGCLVNSGGQNQDLFPFYSRPTGAYFHQNLIIPLLTYTAWCLPTCWVRRWSGGCLPQLPSCHGFARVGGVRTTRTRLNF